MSIGHFAPRSRRLRTRARRRGETGGHGSTAIGSTPQELAARIRSQLKSWGSVIRKAGITGG
jgi:tripartite-type tricarboxylate transporter receptor subunit TctC